MPKQKHQYKTTDKLYFGQYKGEEVRAILQKDPAHIKYLSAKGILFSSEIKGRLGIN